MEFQAECAALAQRGNAWKTIVIAAAVLIVALFCTDNAWATAVTPSGGAPSGSLGEMAAIIIQSFENLAKLITAVSYVLGMSFAIGAIMKFKAHKDNPTQVPVGTPIALLAIAAALIFLPTIFAVVGDTLFGSTIKQEVGGPQGVIFKGSSTTTTTTGGSTP